MEMGAHLRRISFVLTILCFIFSVHAEDLPFPELKDLEIEFYETEVVMTSEDQKTTTLAKEYYDNSSPRGRVDLLAFGNRLSIFYNKATNQILEVGSTACEAWDTDESIYSFDPLFYGWLNKDPLVIGPTAPIFYAQDHRKEIVTIGETYVRGIKCYAYSLDIYDDKNNVTLIYYFADKEWTTPYQVKGLRVPIRIEARGITSMFSEAPDEWMPVDQLTDFSYFKPSITDWLAFQPPLGIGCPLRKTTKTLPKFPKVFKYSAEVYDIMQGKKDETTNIEYQQVWYDADRKLARLDKYTRMMYSSELNDFNTGVTYRIFNGQTCDIEPLRNSFFEGYDGKLMGHLKEPGEVLNLDGEFYYMGQRLVRGIWSDSFESVQQDVTFMKKTLSRLVITIYYSKDFYKVEVEGEEEAQIPIFYVVTGWDTPTNIAINLQYNIFAFDDVIWPTMYQTFGLSRCFPTMNDKSYFIMMLNVQPELGAKMEKLDDYILEEIRQGIVSVSKVSPMRIPLLTADYRLAGVFVTGLLLDRPPAIKQFSLEFEGETTTTDPHVTTIIDADTKEKCAFACVDAVKYTCPGFYMCKAACFIKSRGILEPSEPGDQKRVIGDNCQTWLRAERNSDNKEPYLKDALEKLKKNVQDGEFKINVVIDENTNEIVPVNSIFIGDGPLTDDTAQEKPYTQVIKFAKLKKTADFTQEVPYTDNLNDCYKACKQSDSMSCASFSYCAEAPTKQCLLSSVLVVDRQNNPDDTEDDQLCLVYSMKYLDFFEQYPGKAVLISGDDLIEKVTAVEDCAKKCKEAANSTCRGFEYCKTEKTCVLHSKHILDLKPGEVGDNKKASCVHYATKFVSDYYNMGRNIINDESLKRNEITLEECARVCSEEMKDSCKSFHYCPNSEPYTTDSSCSPSPRVSTDTGISTTESDKCFHYEKKKLVDDWGTVKDETVTIEKESNVDPPGYTKKGFTGLVIGMLALGLILGAVGFVLYSYLRSRSSGEGMSVRFMKSDI